LDRQRYRVPVREHDLPDKGDGPEMRAGKDHALALFVRTRHVLPTIGLDLGEELLRVRARDREDLDVVARLLDEDAPCGSISAPPWGDDLEIAAHGPSGARRCEKGERAHDLGERADRPPRHEGQGALRRAGERSREHRYALASSCAGHIGRKMYHWSGSGRISPSSACTIDCVARSRSLAACFVRSTKIGGRATPLNELSRPRVTAATMIGAPDTRASAAAIVGKAVRTPKNVAWTLSSS